MVLSFPLFRRELLKIPLTVQQAEREKPLRIDGPGTGDPNESVFFFREVSFFYEEELGRLQQGRWVLDRLLFKNEGV